MVTRAKTPKPKAKASETPASPKKAAVKKKSAAQIKKKAPVKKKPAVKAESPAKKQKSHVTRPTLLEEIGIVERQKLAVELYKTFRSVRKVADYLTSKGHEKCSKTTIGQEIKKWLEEARKEIKLSAQDLRDIEIATLNDIQAAVLPRARQYGKKDDVDSMIKIIRERDRFQGASKSHETKDGMRSLLASMLGLDPNEIPLERAENANG